MLGCIGIELVLFILLIFRVRARLQSFCGSSREDQERKRRYKSYIYPMMAYPLVNFILAIPVTTNRIQNWIYPEDPRFILYLLHSIVYPVWGFANALMYFMNKETLRQLHPLSVLVQVLDCAWYSCEETPSGPGDQQRAVVVDPMYAEDTAVFANRAGCMTSNMADSDSDMD